MSWGAGGEIGILIPEARMFVQTAHRPHLQVDIRTAERADIGALTELERGVFATDRLSRRSLARLVRSPSAVVIVAKEGGGRLVGTVIVLFRRGTSVARLYSIAVAPHMGGHGIGPMLLAAAEDAARARGSCTMRLEVHVTNHAAISRYRKSGYEECGRHAGYYEDGGDALRFQKALAALTRPHSDMRSS
jgi:ribosomal protein S18 acetylase RimI-like enzyme